MSKSRSVANEGGGEKVSVIIPCYNSEAFVANAVRSAFEQIHTYVEVIVVDDASTDGSLDILKHLQQDTFPELIVLQHEDCANHGVSATRKRGIDHATGKYIALLDADDCFHPHKLEQQLQIFQQNPDVVICHTGVRVIGEENMPDEVANLFHFRPSAAPYRYASQSDYLIRNGVCCSSVLVKKETLLSVPFFGSQLFQHEDWLCWCLLSQKGHFYFIDEPLVDYLVHPASATTAVRKNVLVAHYSKLEMRLTLAIKSSSWRDSLYSLFMASRSVLAIMVVYAGAETQYQNTHHGKLFKLIQWCRKLKNGSANA